MCGNNLLNLIYFLVALTITIERTRQPAIINNKNFNQVIAKLSLPLWTVAHWNENPDRPERIRCSRQRQSLHSRRLESF